MKPETSTFLKIFLKILRNFVNLFENLVISYMKNAKSPSDRHFNVFNVKGNEILIKTSKMLIKAKHSTYTLLILTLGFMLLQ